MTLIWGYQKYSVKFNISMVSFTFASAFLRHGSIKLSIISLFRQSTSVMPVFPKVKPPSSIKNKPQTKTKITKGSIKRLRGIRFRNVRIVK